MHNRFVRILIWLGIMAVLSLIAMAVWAVATGGSQTTESLKWLQFLQTLGTFLLPPIFCAWLWDEKRKPLCWLKLNKGTDPVLFLLAVGIMVCAMPGINLMADLNGRIELPECLDSIEQKMRAMEATAAALTERFLQADSIGTFLINIGLLALLPALAEELSFRGTLQQIISYNPQDGPTAQRSSIAIWATAILFSAIHMQFYGFIPRMFMGAAFGYLFLWSGTLWIPVLMHFTNNSLAVLAAFSIQHSAFSTNIADTIGAGETWWLGVLSLIITSLGLLIFYRRTHRQ